MSLNSKLIFILMAKHYEPYPIFTFVKDVPFIMTNIDVIILPVGKNLAPTSVSFSLNPV